MIMMSNYIVPVRLEGFVFRVPVSIVNKEDAYYYLVKEPRCDNQCTNLKAKIIDSMRQKNQSLQDAINEVLSNVGDKQVVEAVLYNIMRDLRGYGPITVPLFDPDIEEVELNNWFHPITVVHRDLPGIRLITNIWFNSEVEA
jgi:flagellar protein FlaI